MYHSTQKEKNISNFKHVLLSLSIYVYKDKPIYVHKKSLVALMANLMLSIRAYKFLKEETRRRGLIIVSFIFESSLQHIAIDSF